MFGVVSLVSKVYKIVEDCSLSLEMKGCAINGTC